MWLCFLRASAAAFSPRKSSAMFSRRSAARVLEAISLQSSRVFCCLMEISRTAFNPPAEPPLHANTRGGGLQAGYLTAYLPACLRLCRCPAEVAPLFVLALRPREFLGSVPPSLPTRLFCTHPCVMP